MPLRGLLIGIIFAIVCATTVASSSQPYSLNVERWNKALETVGVPKCKWTQVRERFMKVLLEEHDAILRSYRSTGISGDGIETKPGQSVSFG